MSSSLQLLRCAALATPRGSTPAVAAALGAVDTHAPALLVLQCDKVVAAGPLAELLVRYPGLPVTDLGPGLVVPGLVDAHTHPVFSDTREAEFELRTRGVSYVEISARGGGILSSVRGLRAASKQQLLERLLVRLDAFLALGTTTIEAKSGYGLSLDDEIKSLEVLREAARLHPIEIVPTFLGAHDFPAEYRERRSAYIDLLCEEMLPAVAQARLAEYCDIYTEAHTFDLAQSRRVLTRARELGLGLRLHADQLTQCGGAELAAELGAASADHLENVSADGIDALRRAGTVAVLCPLVPLVLRQDREAPGRRMADAGLPIALSTDYNPGSCYTQSLHEAMTFGALRYRLSAAECLTAATLNAACSLGRGARLGTLEPGKQADFVQLDIENLEQLAYDFGRPRVRGVWKAGRRVAGAGTRPQDQ
jgi:imidazolonepropionase